ncbi:MAG: undecaprenyldiphospho-muramoylpentapeptide beta-N-acetylglucosaminyltransferase [Candidatus Solibacter usitatus]|nr:undecaprenyldiphospho-muramoylpentapeptide beta-N-acetylglucosaminyltransferase [Candidatus Solibacter usitatus]
MAGGGTGGHVIPAVAVAEELRALGHSSVFVGTRRGLEAAIVPRAGFPLEWIEIGGLQNVGFIQAPKSLAQLPWSVVKSRSILRSRQAAAVFSMGGYVAAPVMLAAVLARIPMVLMEPNAMPGLVARRFASRVDRALLSFEQTRVFFPPGRTEITGLPVRQAFFEVPPRPAGGAFHVLITGGSRGSDALNRAARESWPLFRSSGLPLRLTLQCGAAAYPELSRAFSESGLDGEALPFIDDMAAAYAASDLVVSRSGAGAVSELAAAGRPALLVPFPHAADDHQRHNAEALQRAGAARMILERDWSGRALFESVRQLFEHRSSLSEMSLAARALAKPGAAGRAARLLIELAAAR